MTEAIATEDIVVAVDGSLPSRQAAEWAASILLEPGVLYIMTVRLPLPSLIRFLSELRKSLQSTRDMLGTALVPPA